MDIARKLNEAKALSRDNTTMKRSTNDQEPMKMQLGDDSDDESQDAGSSIGNHDGDKAESAARFAQYMGDSDNDNENDDDEESEDGEDTSGSDDASDTQGAQTRSLEAMTAGMLH
jgi:hypothetical protein